MHLFKLSFFLNGILHKEAAPFELDGSPPPEPTDPQKKAGNYRKDHISFGGLDISVENRAGTVRSGKDPGGGTWSVKMPWHYGYLKRTKAPDNNQLDVFLKPDSVSPFMCYIIRQTRPGTDVFDEYKCMIGWARRDDAVKAYMDAYEKGWRGYGGVASLPLPKFREWARKPWPLRFSK